MTNNKAYFEIIKLNTLVSEFNISILSELSDAFYGLTLKQLSRKLESGKRITPYFYFINTEMIESSDLKLLSKHELPMLVHPLNWNNILQGGGYLSNSNGFYSGQHLRHDRGWSKLSSTSIDVLNYLQSMPFGVDQAFFKKSCFELYSTFVKLLREKYIDFIFIYNKDKDIIEFLNFKDSVFSKLGDVGRKSYSDQ